MKEVNSSIVLLLLLFCSCSNSQQKNTLTEKKEPSSLEHISLKTSTDSTLPKWIAYYKENHSSFSLANFHIESTDSLRIIKGNVLGKYDKEFDKIYLGFLIHNSDSSQYLDIDSYSWFIDENGELSFSPDQEINLVNIKNQTVRRIGFRGPSQWVEDAYWNNDSTIVLLENNYENQPRITIIGVKNHVVSHYKFMDTLAFDTDYTQQRFKQKGIK